MASVTVLDVVAVRTTSLGPTALSVVIMALRPHPWVTSRGDPAGEGRAESAEVEHGEGDEGFG